MIPTQRQIDLMDPKDRKQFPKRLQATTSERQAKNEAKSERKMHSQFSGYLRARNKVYQFIHADPSKRSTIEPGWPDYTVIHKIGFARRPFSNPFTEPIFRPVACLIELKAPGGRLSEIQVKKFAELEAAGIPVFVCTTLKDAIEQLTEFFDIAKEALR